MPQRPGFPDDDPQAPAPASPFTFATPPTVRNGSRPGFPDADPGAPDPLQLTFDQARKQTAAAAAHVFDLRLRTNLPTEVIQRNLPAAEAQARRGVFDPAAFRTFNPQLTSWLEEDPLHAAVAQDDLTSLSGIERALRVGVNATRAAVGGTYNLVPSYVFGVARLGAELAHVAGVPHATEWSDYFGAQANTAIDIANTIAGKGVSEATGLESDFYSGFTSLGQQLPITLATGALNLDVKVASTIAAAMMGLSTALPAMGRALDEGKPLLNAVSYGAFQGEVEYATERIPALWFLRDLKRNPGFARLLWHQLASEVPGEQVATVLQDLADWAELNPELSLQSFVDSYASQIPAHALSTLVATVTMVGAQSALVKAIDVATNTTSDERTITALHKAVDDTTLRETAPEAFNTIVARMAKGGMDTVAVTAQTFGDYFQEKGEDPAALATALTGDPTAYEQALAKPGGEFTIPTANYLSQVPGSGHDAFWTNELRLGTNALNVRETKAELAAAVDDPEARSAAYAADQEARQKVYDDTVAKALATGRFTQDEAAQQGIWMASVFGAVGSRMATSLTAAAVQELAHPGAIVASGRRSDPNPNAVPLTAQASVPGIPASVGGKRETRTQRSDRVAGHTAALTQYVVADALRTDPTADPEAVARAFQMRLELHSEGQEAVAESGLDNGTLLRAIAEYGGLRTDMDVARGGEFRVLAEGADPRRSARSPHTWKGVKGLFRADGKTPDRMTEALREDPRFTEHIADYDALVDRLTTALSAGAAAGTAVDPSRLPGSDELSDLGVELGARWWSTEYHQGDSTEIPTEMETRVSSLEALTPGLRAGTFKRRRDVKVYIQDMVLGAATRFGVSLDPSRPGVRDYLVRVGIRDALTGIAFNPNAIGWYEAKVREAIAVLTLLHPELGTDKNALFAFKWALAATSQGLSVNTNFALAERVYGYYKTHGRMPTNAGFGISRDQINKNLKKFNVYLKRGMTVDQLREFMVTPSTPRALRQAGFDTDGELADQPVLGALVLGAKIGNGFFANLSGIFDQLTADRWFTRSWGRWTGTLLKDNRALLKKNRSNLRAAIDDLAPGERVKLGTLVGVSLAGKGTDHTFTDAALEKIAKAVKKASGKTDIRTRLERTPAGQRFRLDGNTLADNLRGEKEAPTNQERVYMREVVGRIHADMVARGYAKMTVADLQAILWYAEKRLYDAGTGSPDDSEDGFDDDKAPDYSNAAVTLAKGRVPDADVAAALQRVRARAGTAGHRRGLHPTGGGQTGAPGRTRRVAVRPGGRFDGRPADPAPGIEGQLDPFPDTEFFQADTHATFYSRLARAVESSPQASASGAQWKATIKHAKAGINQDEFALTQVQDLENGTTYTKEEVLQYLRAHRVEVREVLLGGEPDAKTQDRIEERAYEIYDAAVDEAVADAVRNRNFGEASAEEQDDSEDEDGLVTWNAVVDGEVVGSEYETEAEALVVAEEYVEELRQAFEDEQREDGDGMGVSFADAQEQAREELGDGDNATHYQEYSVEGPIEEGSYREAFITAPARPRDTNPDIQVLDVFPPTTANAIPFTVTVNGAPWKNLVGGHDKTFYVGTAEPDSAKVAQALQAWRAGEASRSDAPTWSDGHDEYRDIENPIVRIRLNIRTSADGQRVLFLEEVQPPGPENQKQMPVLFLKHWRAIAFKWALRYGVDQGVDAIAWTTGAQQAKHYSLEKQVRRIEWAPQSLTFNGATETGGRHVTIDLPNGLARMDLAPNGQVVKVIGVAPDDWLGKNIVEVIGKEVSERIFGSENGQLQGDGLKIGGEGLKRLYDVDFVNVVNSLPAVKRNGGKVGTVQIDAGHTSERATDIIRLGTAWAFVTTAGEQRGGYATRAEAVTAAAEFNAGASHPTMSTQPALPLTPALKAAVREGQALFQGEDETPAPGRHGSYNPITRVISLFKTQNRTTFLHESAHLFFDVLSDITASEHTTPQLQADMGALLAHVGFEGDLAAWRALSNEERRAGHEVFARTVEQYLGQGKAPTPELQPLFARFATWILGFYKTLKHPSINIDISPEVRAVLDRLHATDAQLKAAEADAHVGALFTTAAQAKMTDVEFEGYRAKAEAASAARQATLAARVLTDLHRARLQWWQDERTTMRATVAAEVAAEPVYRALAGMRGELDTPATPLSKAALVAQFGRDVLKRLPRPYVYAADSGLSADTVATLYGFASGEALVEALVTAPDFDQVVDARTDTRMEQAHGDIFHDPARLEEEARTIVADEHRDDLIRTELALLNKLRTAAQPSVRAEKTATKDKARAGTARLRTEMPDPATLARLAQAQVATMPLRTLRTQVQRFYNTARRSSMEATRAAGTQDFDTAITAKQAELFHLALFREATARVAELDETRATFAKMFGNDAALAKRRDMGYVQAARVLAATYFWPEKRLGDAREAFTLVKEYDTELAPMLEEQIDGVVAAGTDLGALTVAQFTMLRETVAQLWEQSLRSQQIRIDGQLVDRDIATTQLTTRLDDINAPLAEQRHTKGELRLLGLRAAARRVEHWVSYVDGGAPGPFRRILWNPVIEGTETYRIHKRDYLAQYLALVDGIKDTLTPGTITAPELGGFVFGVDDGNGRAALLHALLHTGNESNYQKLLRGYRWGVVRADGTLDDARWKAFLTRAYDTGLVTKRDMDFVQAVWDLVGSVKSEAQRAHREMYGTYFSEITAWPVETPFGPYAGGYVPALVDPLWVAQQSIYGEKAALEGNDNASMFPTAGKGFTKARQEQYAKPLALNLQLIPSHLDKVLRFIHIEPRIRDVGRLLWGHGLRDRLNAYDPTVLQSLLIPWLQRTANQRVAKASQGQDGQAADWIFRGLRARVGLNMMAGHVMNTLQQFTGGFIAALKVKPRYLRNALWRRITQADDFKAALAESKFMTTRLTPAAFELQQQLEDILLNPSRYETVQQWGQQHGYLLQSSAQNLVDQIVWAGGYEQATERHDATHAEAIRAGDAAVRETQGSFEPADIAKFEAQIPFVRAFVMFSGYFNMLANVNGTELGLVVRDLGLKKGAGRALYIYLFGFMLPAVLSEAITQAIGGWDDDDDDTHLDELMWLFFGSQIRTGAAMVPFAGQIATAAYNLYATQTTADDRISSSPAVGMVENAVRAPLEVYRAVFEAGPKRKAVRDLIDLLGLLTGLPVGAFKRPAGYLADVYDGNEEPDDALEATRGLVSGRAQDAR